MPTFWEWLQEKQRKEDRAKEWQPIPLELPIDDPSTMITPPTTSSKPGEEDMDGVNDDNVIELI